VVALRVLEAELNSRHVIGAGGVLDNDAALGLEVAHGPFDLGQFERLDTEQHENLVLRKLAGQHVFGGQDHAGPAEARQVVQRHGDAPVVVPINGHVRQRIESAQAQIASLRPTIRS